MITLEAKFKNSLIIHKAITKKIITVTEVLGLIISIDFYDFSLRLLLKFNLFRLGIYIKIRQKYSATRRNYFQLSSRCLEIG